MRTSIHSRRAMALAALTAAIILGGTGTAFAANVTTSLNNVYAGFDGPWRTASSSTISQTFDFGSLCYYGGAGAPVPEYAQMQLQRANGIFAPISEGNRDVSCANTAGAQSWGARVGGIQYRYQFNGAKRTGIAGLGAGPFSASIIYIQY